MLKVYWCITNCNNLSGLKQHSFFNSVYRSEIKMMCLSSLLRWNQGWGLVACLFAVQSPLPSLFLLLAETISLEWRTEFLFTSWLSAEGSFSIQRPCLGPCLWLPPSQTKRTFIRLNPSHYLNFSAILGYNQLKKSLHWKGTHGMLGPLRKSLYFISNF